MVGWVKDFAAVASILATVYGILMAGWVIEQLVK